MQALAVEGDVNVLRFPRVLRYGQLEYFMRLRRIVAVIAQRALFAMIALMYFTLSSCSSILCSTTRSSRRPRRPIRAAWRPAALYTKSSPARRLCLFQPLAGEKRIRRVTVGLLFLLTCAVPPSVEIGLEYVVIRFYVDIDVARLVFCLDFLDHGRNPAVGVVPYVIGAA